ncbi:SDR family NAD(P)-dependent oxidoreductase [Fodinibius sediminis]|uniref:NAD(P)-dependent dehydrogenase, short-chain alcohol dehydrogenase family n=1 Tax=Fodinibius sediminis TaxID=1214077 RepID=A0A521DPL9_9BACT|nr:SDR family oxidoreductase [Fodinibius sediminis]SMO73654.1 NAD(P)-dependent dehydrogenase, short-chain alcohol dehydrogenase family [Fodinibius sediminis]
MRLKDKVIIVTGSTTGIGKAIAVRCVEEGARVVVNGLSQSEGEAVVTELGRDRAILHVGDISDPETPKKLVDEALTAFGRLDAVVNNAAMVVSSNIHTTDSQLLHKVFGVNAAGPLALVKTALPHLGKTRGCVLNIGSVNAYSGEPELLAYSMSKGALMTMTRNLGDVLFREEGVRVNQVNPGWVLTENETIRKHNHGLDEDWYKELPKRYAPAGRILWPKEIAAAAIYWLSDESGPVSGQVVDLEQYPYIGRNAPKDETTIPKDGD